MGCISPRHLQYQEIHVPANSQQLSSQIHFDTQANLNQRHVLQMIIYGGPNTWQPLLVRSCSRDLHFGKIWRTHPWSLAGHHLSPVCRAQPREQFCSCAMLRCQDRSGTSSGEARVDPCVGWPSHVWHSCGYHFFRLDICIASLWPNIECMISQSLTMVSWSLRLI